MIDISFGPQTLVGSSISFFNSTLAKLYFVENQCSLGPGNT